MNDGGGLCKTESLTQTLYKMAKTELGKIPPHSIEAEKSVLGSLLIDKNAIIKIADLINPDDFYHDANGIIYEGIFSLFHKRVPLDLLTLADTLEKNDKLDLVGGRVYLAELTEEVPTSSHVLQYASIVKEKSTLRKLIRAGR